MLGSAGFTSCLIFPLFSHFFSCYLLGGFSFLVFSFFQPPACDSGIFLPSSLLTIHCLGWGAPAGGAARLAGSPAWPAAAPGSSRELPRSMGLQLGAPAPASLPLRPEVLPVLTPSTRCWCVCPLLGSGGVSPGVKPNPPRAALSDDSDSPEVQLNILQCMTWIHTPAACDAGAFQAVGQAASFSDLSVKIRVGDTVGCRVALLRPRGWRLGSLAAGSPPRSRQHRACRPLL